MRVNTGKIMTGIAVVLSWAVVILAGGNLLLLLVAGYAIVTTYFYLRQIERKQAQERLAQLVEHFANKLMNDLKEDLNKESLDDYAAKN